MKTILVIEDDQFLLTLFSKKLTENNYNVLFAKNGEDGLNILKKDTVDLVALDILLPGMSGLNVLSKIRSNPQTKDVPVIVLSNLGQKDDQEKAKTLGANEYLIKAMFTLDEIIEKIDTLTA